MKLKFTLAIIACLLLLTSCAPSEMELRSRPDNVYVFEVNENYQQVYRKIKSYLLERYAAPETDVSGDLYTDLNKGVISITALAGFTFVADIEPISETETRVTTRGWVALWKTLGERIERDLFK